MCSLFERVWPSHKVFSLVHRAGLHVSRTGICSSVLSVQLDAFQNSLNLKTAADFGTTRIGSRSMLEACSQLAAVWRLEESSEQRSTRRNCRKIAITLIDLDGGAGL